MYIPIRRKRHTNIILYTLLYMTFELTVCFSTVFVLIHLILENNISHVQSFQSSKLITLQGTKWSVSLVEGSLSYL